MDEGIYYFRVHAIDNEGTTSLWSNIESIEIQILVTTLTLPLVPGFSVEALVVSVALCLGISLFKRSRRKCNPTPTARKEPFDGPFEY
ncbi:MAG: hypothetical protein ACFE89_12405 [Candidatus Hodarchaeota archaeon]